MVVVVVVVVVGNRVGVGWGPVGGERWGWRWKMGWGDVGPWLGWLGGPVGWLCGPVGLWDGSVGLGGVGSPGVGVEDGGKGHTPRLDFRLTLHEGGEACGRLMECVWVGVRCVLPTLPAGSSVFIQMESYGDSVSPVLVLDKAAGK